VVPTLLQSPDYGRDLTVPLPQSHCGELEEEPLEEYHRHTTVIPSLSCQSLEPIQYHACKAEKREDEGNVNRNHKTSCNAMLIPCNLRHDNMLAVLMIHA